jgi:hypothetical protein
MRRVRLAINSVRSVRITRPQLSVVAVLSAAASALLINSALGSSAAQSAALAALSQGQGIASTAPAGAAAASGTGGTPAVPVSVTPSTPSAPPVAAGPSAAAPSGGGAVPGGGGTTTPTTPNSPNARHGHHHPHSHSPQHQVNHVFVIALSTPSFEDAWGTTSVAHYLNRTLKPKGVFLGGYETLGSAELPDSLAMVSGQAPNSDTEAECATYAEFPAGTSPAKDGQVPGSGCVYPNTIITVADQVTAAGKGWRGYIDGLTSQACVHPNSGALDDAPLPYSGPNYDTRHNPFIYFHSLLDLGGCSTNDVSLKQLPKDLRTQTTTPAYSYMAPGACQDGSAQSCSDGSPAGLAGEDAFLKQWVPVIQHSAAYKKDGVIVIVFSLAGGSGGGSAPVGALVLSRWAKPGQIISTTYNPYSILRGSEDLLGLTPLASAKSAKSFITDALPGT